MKDQIDDLLKEFDELFTNEDGLIDKYSWYGSDGPAPLATPQSIKIWLSEKVKEIKYDTKRVK
jgi:hypothetical protein